MSTLLARKLTMKDEAAGLQNFVFAWCGLPRTSVLDNRGEPSEIYLENIAPLFYIDQNEGWTDLQALQVHRYGLLEVSDIAVEYLLGAVEAIEVRFAPSRPSRRARPNSKRRQRPSRLRSPHSFTATVGSHRGWITAPSTRSPSAGCARSRRDAQRRTQCRPRRGRFAAAGARGSPARVRGARRA